MSSRFRVSVALAGTLVASLGWLAGPAHAAVGDIIERRVPTVGSGGLNRITMGPDGNIWFTNPGANQIGRMTPSGVFTGFNIPSAGSSPIDIVTGPDGNIWFTEYEGRIGRLTIASGQITEFPILRTPGGAPANVFGITVGPDGALWFITDCCDPSNPGKIGRLTTAGVSTLFPTSAATAPTVGITTGPDGNLWYPVTTTPHLDRIQRMSPTGVVNGNFDIPTQFADPSRIVTGPDGNLWFTEQGAVGGNLSPGKIGRITPAGVITEFETPNQNPPSNPAGIAAGPDGNLWYTEYSYLRTMTGIQQGGNRIGRITPAGVITEFPLPTQYARADGITAGPDGAMYFTESPSNFTFGAVGRIQALPTVVPPPPAVVPPPPPPPVAAIVRRKGKLSATVTPSSDLKKPYVFRTSGKLTLPSGITKTAGCSGRVSVQIKRGQVTISTRRATLTKSCKYSTRVTFSNNRRFSSATRLKFTARFLGNSRVAPSQAKSRFARIRRL